MSAIPNRVGVTIPCLIILKFRECLRFHEKKSLMAA